MSDTGFDTVAGFDSAKFNSVWRRVMAEKSGDSQSPGREESAQKHVGGELNRLRRFMDGESADAQLYGRLACMSRGYMRRTLLEISDDERRHLSRLMAVYFILTGSTYAPAASCPVVCNLAEALRMRYSDEKEGQRAYLEAAGKAASAELSDLYRDLAGDEERHAKTIRCLIENMF